MPTARSLLAALALTFAVGACDRDAPTSPPAGTDNQAPTAPQITKQPLIFPGGGQQRTSVAGVVYTLQSIQVSRFDYEAGELLVTGRLTFTDAAGATFTEDIARAPATLTKGGAPTAPTCQILNLDLGPLHLDLLGLVVDLDEVHLDITAVSGPGALLGNLLCSLVGLLDPAGGSPLQTAITNLLNTINQLLQGLLP
jgi:hypothetical protein